MSNLKSEGQTRRPLLWGEMTSPQIEQCAEDQYLVILPCGSTEQHGWHLPVDTDTHMVSIAAHRAALKMRNVLVLPTLPFGFSPQHLNAAGTVTLSVTTFHSLIRDILKCVAHHGFNRVVILNGHGANEDPLRAYLRELANEIPMWMLMVTYWYLIDADQLEGVREGGMGSMGHAGELETSIQMHLRPYLVEMSRAVTNPVRPPMKHMWADLFAPGPAILVDGLHPHRGPRVAGDAVPCTAEKGEKLLDYAVEHLVDYLEEFIRLTD